MALDRCDDKRLRMRNEIRRLERSRPRIVLRRGRGARAPAENDGTPSVVYPTERESPAEVARRLLKDTERLPSRAESRLAKVGTLLKCESNKTIYTQGSAPHGIYYIQEGMVILTIQSKHRRPAVTAVLGAGDFFNEICLLDISHCLSTARAITSSSILLIAKEKMTSLLRREKVVSASFASALLSSMLRFKEDLTNALVNSPEQRLARALLRLANLGKRQRMARIPKVSQQVLAEMIGTTRPRANLFMTRFRKRGFVDYNGGLEVHSSLRSVLLRH